MNGKAFLMLLGLVISIGACGTEGVDVTALPANTTAITAPSGERLTVTHVTMSEMPQQAIAEQTEPSGEVESILPSGDGTTDLCRVRLTSCRPGRCTASGCTAQQAAAGCVVLVCRNCGC